MPEVSGPAPPAPGPHLRVVHPVAQDGTKLRKTRRTFRDAFGAVKAAGQPDGCGVVEEWIGTVDQHGWGPAEVDLLRPLRALNAFALDHQVGPTKFREDLRHTLVGDPPTRTAVEISKANAHALQRTWALRRTGRRAVTSAQPPLSPCSH